MLRVVKALPLQGDSSGAADLGDAELLERVASGDLDALGLIYDRHYPTVLRFCRRAVGQDAEDLAQETFLTASRAAARYDGRPSCRPWLIGIAARGVLHRQRSFTRFQNVLRRFASDKEASAAQAPAQDPEQSRQLQRALAELPAPKRVVLILAEAEGLSGQEIARQLNIPVGTVWTRLHHAKKQLRALLEAERP